jgi:HSP20 family molecular chaperone IbpA
MARRKASPNESPNGTEDLNTFINKLFNEMIESRELPVAPGAVYRFDISVNQNGITITPNMNGQVQSLKVEEKEPLVDVIERKDGITVIAELPGVEKKRIELHADHERLSMRADSAKGVYSKLVALPSKVDPSTAAATYNNGVLEVEFKRSNTYRSIVKIDVK